MRKTVIIDTKEKKPHFWEESDWCEGYIVQHLDTGDYSLQGYEDVFTIERKASTSELAKNICEGRFVKELIRMEKIKHAFLICEFSFDDIVNFPINSGIPKRKWDYLQITNKLLIKRIAEYQVKYNTKILFAGTRENAFELMSSIFKRIIENVK